MSLFSAFERAGINVAMLMRPGIMGSPVFEYEPPEEIVEADTVLHIGEPPTWNIVEGKRNVGLCWWPFSKIPIEWQTCLYGVDDLIVPSKWCAEGVTMPREKQRVIVTPLGIDPATFVPFKRERREQLRFLFFDNHADQYKAGVDVTIPSFLRAFFKRDNAALDIWSTHPCNVLAPDVRIQINRHIGTDDDLVRLYRRYDALLCTSRGAGFGLIPVEAMATGLPVFHTGQAGYETFADVGVLIGARKTTTVHSAHVDACCFEPQVDLLVGRLRQFDEQYDRFQEAAIRDAAIVRQRFTWDNTATDLIAALGARTATFA